MPALMAARIKAGVCHRQGCGARMAVCLPPALHGPIRGGCEGFGRLSVTQQPSSLIVITEDNIFHLPGEYVALLCPGHSLTLEGVDRHVEGTYLCTADNGIGESASAAMTITVEYPPEITTEKVSVRRHSDGEKCIKSGK
ncbi:hypothetical protein E2C01_087760 [Portunus trituberculatus]|uniref:Ig-like domain-containing protein n=1 Tax=Portunus trituberculatus TaxID=210409 RepID=A0A5B7JHC5_PORTR|nr:hypothetical protein [Portunus trituberculatus]